MPTYFLLWRINIIRDCLYRTVPENYALRQLAIEFAKLLRIYCGQKSESLFVTVEISLRNAG